MNTKCYNIGIDILKIISCMGVVMMHFGMSSWLAHCAVPVFMMVSIYLGGAVFIGGGVIGRMKRLMVPYFCWGVVYFIARTILHGSLDIELLARQFVFGAPACPVMYFIELLVVFTVMLAFVSLSRFSGILVAAIMVLCLAMQYCGWHVAVARCLPKEGAITLGRSFELFPAAAIGYFFFKHGKRLSKCAWMYAAMPIAGVAGLLFPTCEGYGYQGVGMLALSAAVFTVVSALGMTVAHDIKLPAVRLAASLTAGIYYMHLLVGWGLERVIGDLGRIATPIVMTVTALSVYALMKIPYVRILVK